MQIEGSVALVTGANRGIGHAIALALLENGAKKVYAGARKPETITDPRLTPLKLDVTNPEDIAAAAELAQDVNIVVNNAGMGGGEAQLLSGPLSTAREIMETNVFGPWEIARAFAPRLAAGALVNVLSVVSWWPMAYAPGYAASKAAEWSLTNSLRLGLPDTLVVGVHCGFVDTDFSAWTSAPKITAQDLAAQTVEALRENRIEVLADQFTRDTRVALGGGIEAVTAFQP
ncbi:SDR family oxidoreductase [Lentzea sp. NPDC051838]|uniref:SDR family oxidoreductase n=1 Tax=Lentzea sp. NPDC051838 TaxID=3154849 RepID=UPI003420AEEB